MTRYAIYFAPPPESALWRFGASVIGYDAATAKDVPFAIPAGMLAEDWAAKTEDPRRYGFHATLKAPFELSEKADAEGLLVDAGMLAASLAPVSLGALAVAEIGRFIALVSIAQPPALETFASRIVEDLDRLRAPLSVADRARRLKSPLTPRQLDYLDRYGYPYVREEFRFHMTLTGPIAGAAERARVREGLAAAYTKAVAAGPVVIDALTVFRQDTRRDRFRIIARLPQSGRPSA